MTEIKLSCGFTAEVDETAIDDAEMLEQLTAMDDGDPTAVIRIMKLFGNSSVRSIRTTVGAEQEYFLIDRSGFDRYDLMKGENGRTPAEATFKAVEEIFGQLNSKKK